MKKILHLVTIALSIILIGSLASLFQNGMNVSFTFFLTQVVENVKSFITLTQLTYESPAGSGVERSIFPLIFEYYGYSLFILLGGFSLSLISALLLTYLTFLVPPSIRVGIKKAVGILEAIPDILIIVIVQLSFIAFYRETGILLFEVVGAFKRPIVLPLLTFAILPCFFLYRMMLLMFEDELMKPYIELALGKGLTRGRILWKHVTRNCLLSVVNHSKAVILLLLTNLVMLEVIYNLYGMTWFMINHMTGQIVTFGILMIFLPLYLLEALAKRWITHLTGEEVPS
ncbi:ABC transporter permease subunit [Guptibacillus spartinae]|uniref:ABC transporter permease subunit n=1 Tax=Guptibacillus spartinae TaxID=3025679 RepID=UPI0023617707|nr:ABC transporter permease subunit [Pseudalkalibacillus spartinae]